MRKIVTALASAAALALLASAANADCAPAHKNVTASANDGKQVVAMSTVQEPDLQPALEQTSDEAAAAQPICGDEKNGCTPATE